MKRMIMRDNVFIIHGNRLVFKKLLDPGPVKSKGHQIFKQSGLFPDNRFLHLYFTWSCPACLDLPVSRQICPLAGRRQRGCPVLCSPV